MPTRRSSTPAGTGPDDRISGPELRDLLAHLLSGTAGGSEAHWRQLVGEVEVLPIALHPRCNWRVSPAGTDGEQRAIEAAVEVVREAHPYVRGG